MTGPLPIQHYAQVRWIAAALIVSSSACAPPTLARIENLSNDKLSIEAELSDGSRRWVLELAPKQIKVLTFTPKTDSHMTLRMSRDQVQLATIDAGYFFPGGTRPLCVELTAEAVLPTKCRRAPITDALSR